MAPPVRVRQPPTYPTVETPVVCEPEKYKKKWPSDKRQVLEPPSLCCHWGVSCMVVGTPHPGHPFTKSHPTDYEIARDIWGKTKKTDGWKMNVYKMKGFIVHPIVWEYLCGTLKVFKGFLNALIQPVKFHFILIQGWSSKWAWSWWLLSLFPPFRGKR